MAKWIIKLSPNSEDDLCALDRSIKQRVVEKLRWLGEHFLNINPEPLGWKWKGYYKLRIGDLRVIYKPEHENRVIYSL